MKKKIMKVLIAGILFILAITLNVGNDWINKIIFILSYLIVGFGILKKAFRNIKRGEVFDENFLMSIATLGAFAIGEFPEAVAVMLFYQVGEIFQNYAVNKSRKSIATLMDIRPEIANVIRNDNVEEVDPDEIKIDEIIVVKPGEKVPLDGIVIEGKSNLDTKALTGESLPRKAIEGNEVLSGCINLDGLIKLKVTKEYSDSTVSKILELVENASNRKAKSENFITKFAKYYTPIVVVIAVMLAVLPPLVFENATFVDWIYRALSFLVVSCPCALVISIPLSFFSGIGAASKMGVLIKGSNFLEAIANTEIAVFDKTGTLTEGVFEVQQVNAINMPEDELLDISAHVECYSEHPIALSVKKAYNKEIDEKRITKTEDLTGRGLMAVVDGKEVLIGNERLMNENQIEFSKCEEVGTVLYIAIEKVYAGYILIADKIKEDAIIAIKELKKNNIKQTVMLTGDRKNVGENVATKLGMDKVFAELLPQNKVEKVEQLLKEKSEKGKLIFAGDGINDAPVIALADIGIAMGALGSDAAIEAADVVIMTDEPSKIVNAIKLSKKTMRIVNQNIWFAILVKIVVLILSAVGLSNMWQAVFADVGVSVIAVLNALRILRIK